MKNIQLTLSLLVTFIIAVSFLPNILDAMIGNKSQEDNFTKKEEEKSIAIKELDYGKGKIVFDKLKNRVCDELDLCWISQGYAINGDKILRKEFPAGWGNKSVLIIPQEEWVSLSKTNRDDLGNYLRSVGVNEIITGRVKPAEFSDGSINPDRNVITVDETVWSSNN
jgi:hypothetical protein